MLVEEARRRRRASVRCSFRITAVGGGGGGKVSVLEIRRRQNGRNIPSCRSLPISSVFSFSSFSRVAVWSAFVEEEASCSYKSRLRV